MNLDNVHITTERYMIDPNPSNPDCNDGCTISLTLDIRISDSERKASHDEVMVIFRRHAEELTQIIKKLL